MTTPTVEQVLTDPCAHDWLKAALLSALTKDVVDVANDAEVLAAVLRARCDAILH